MPKTSKEERSKKYSIFGNRLDTLMNGKGISSVAKLSRELYNNNLIKYGMKESYLRDFEMGIYNETEYKKLNKKMLTNIEKQINRMMNNDINIDIEYLRALMKYFDCSSDYLLGVTEYPTSNIEFRALGEKLSLSNKAITNLENSLYRGYFGSKYKIPRNANALDLLLSSEVFGILVDDIEEWMLIHNNTRSKYENDDIELRKVLNECGITYEEAQKLEDSDYDYNPGDPEPTKKQRKAVVTKNKIDDLWHSYDEEIEDKVRVQKYQTSKDFNNLLDDIFSEKPCTFERYIKYK